MESVLDKMTDDQRKILKEFKESLNVDLDPRYTDELLVKFLRAKNFNIKASKKIFLENYYNRIMFGVNTLLETYTKPEVAEKYEATTSIGFAKNGSLIRYIGGGRLDFYGLIMSMSCADLCLYFSHVMELDRKSMMDESLRTGRTVSEITFIVDLEEFSVQQVLHKNVIEMGLDYARLLQDCYPEIWSNVFIVNAPKIFDSAYGVFKAVLRPTVLEKIRMVNKSATKDLLLQYIDEDVLPAFLGGRRVDSNGDPMCKEFMIFGGKIPEKFYSQHCRIQLSLDDPEVRCVTIPPRSMYNYSMPITGHGYKIKVQARTESGSISLSVLYQELGPDPNNIEFPGEFEYLDENCENFKYKQVSVEIRAQYHSTQEDLVVSFPWPGLYIIRFSNASSWFSSRKLYVKSTIIPPKPRSAS